MLQAAQRLLRLRPARLGGQVWPGRRAEGQEEVSDLFDAERPEGGGAESGEDEGDRGEDGDWEWGF